MGFNVQADGTRAALFALSCLALIGAFLICRAVVTSKLGKVLIAVRDAESRTRFLGYRVESYKLFVFTLSACMIHNGATPNIEVDSETYEVRADGELLTCAPAEILPMAQRYFMF